jgi:hypothetical protein
VLCDTEDANDWVIDAKVDVERSRAEGRPVISVDRIGA